MPLFPIDAARLSQPPRDMFPNKTAILSPQRQLFPAKMCIVRYIFKVLTRCEITRVFVIGSNFSVWKQEKAQRELSTL